MYLIILFSYIIGSLGFKYPRAIKYNIQCKNFNLRPISMNPQDIADSLRYFAAGGIACSFSHGLAVPFDVVK